MSQQPNRQLAPEERDYLKSKTRANNVITWFTGLSLFGMVGVGLAVLAVCGGGALCCVLALASANAQ